MSRKEHVTSLTPSPHVLTWRIDPDESLSDWTLTVISNASLDQKKHEDDEQDEDRNQEETGRRSFRSAFVKTQDDRPTKKYFVHRTQLAVGPRRSEYFAKLFRDKQKKGPKNNATRIELRPSAANAFPQMLDFIYSPVGSPAEVTSENAVALRHLATCFGIRELFDSVTEFIKRDLCPETSTTYLMEAQAFRHEKLSEVSLKLCAQNFEIIKFSKIVTLPPESFEKVVVSDELVCSSEVLSSRVASYCRCRPGAVDADMLKRITDIKKMPAIAPEESLFFLHLISEIGDDDETIDKSGPSRTQDLYKRCVAASTDIVRMAIGNKEESTSKKAAESRPKRNAVKEYRALTSATKVDLLENALSNSPTLDELEALEHARHESKKKLASTATKRLQEMEAEMARARRIYETKLASLQATIETQEQEVHAYATELAKFSRVPNDYRTAPLLSECTFQAKPQYDKVGNSVYGQVPPSALPRIGCQREDGWIYREDRWTKDGRQVHGIWPMYFYKGDA